MDRFDDIAAFVAVADAGSFVGAARRLGKSPPIVTRSVARLEQRLGLRLFHRTTRAVALTESGREQLDRAQQLLADLAALESSAAERRREPGGLIKITASVVFGRLHVQPLVTEFLRRYPRIDARFELTDRVVSLVEEGIDIGVRLGSLADSRLKAIRAGRVRRAVYASPSYLAANGDPKVPADLARHTCISFTGTTTDPLRWTFGAGKARQVIAVRPRLVSNLADPLIDSAVSGFGLVCVLSYMVDHLVAAGALRPVLVEYEPPSVPIHVVRPPGPHPSATTKAFLDLAVPALRGRFSA